MKETVLGILPWYLVVLNLVTFCFYGADKRKAKKETWRIPERVLVGLAACGGSLGALLEMWAFHHKTRKWKFRLLAPLFFLLWAGALVYLYLF